MDSPPAAPGSSNGSPADGGAEEVLQGCRLVMPSQAELSAAADGGQLVKAVHMHGGLITVGRRLGASLRKG